VVNKHSQWTTYTQNEIAKQIRAMQDRLYFAMTNGTVHDRINAIINLNYYLRYR